MISKIDKNQPLLHYLMGLRSKTDQNRQLLRYLMGVQIKIDQNQALLHYLMGVENTKRSKSTTIALPYGC